MFVWGTLVVSTHINFPENKPEHIRLVGDNPREGRPASHRRSGLDFKATLTKWRKELEKKRIEFRADPEILSPQHRSRERNSAR